MDILDQLSELGKPVLEKKLWMNDVQFILATSQMLDTIAEECIAAKVYGLDLETTGLDQRAFRTDTGKFETVDKIVGFCIAPSKVKGYYIPVRHKNEGSSSNVPLRLVIEMLRKIQASGAVAVFHNAKFDHKFLMYEPGGATEGDEPKLWEDTLTLAYMRTRQEKDIGLKTLSRKELGREMIELKELFTPEQVKAKQLDFSTLDPTWEPVVWYACSDAVNTLALFEILHHVVVDKDAHGRSQKTVYMIEKICLTATIWMEQNRIYIDKKKLVELIQLGQKEWWESINQVYDEVQALLERDIRPSWVRGMGKDFNPEVLDPSYMEARAR